MSLRKVFLMLTATVLCTSSALFAAPDCIGPATPARKTGDQITDWFESFVKPFRAATADATAPKLTRAQVEAYIEDVAPFHRRAVLDSVFFESLVERVLASYKSSTSFRGIDGPGVEKIYKGSTGPRVDFSMVCVSPRTVKTTDDAFGFTLFGVTIDDCQHIGLRGLVFSDTLVNGSSSGTCRPDHIYYRAVFIPVPAGTNDITFVCRRDQIGCAR